ncbi:acyl-CoA synthetase [Leekyejoonella antrihumi]|uniref:Long-chain fatty acid--CoA ligase n=1 Tax=Leekyejoonella antrihumi TaxID=1660198 RepID=A0A563E9U3_9MICO|nr:long-chain fatty acid--CoA ligase [Leekyejoonella antrihumi]TWP38564.1 long-chain fatty acid--CoA ligase [Leekyejoonella antrihumi]
MQDKGIGSWAARRARMSPHRIALRQGVCTRTYAQLADDSAKVAHGLRRNGVGPGDRVAFLGLNSIELVVAMFATARLGAVFLPLNTRLAAPETAYILADSEPVILLWESGFEDIVHSATVRALGVPELRLGGPPGGRLGALAVTGAGPMDEPVGLDELFMIQYTSGTSGRPKGVQLTHGNIAWNVYNVLVDVDIRSDEVALVTAPLFHTAALNQLFFPTFLKGGTALVEAKFDADRALGLIEEHGVTFLFGVTSMYLALTRASAWADADLRSLRSAISGGAPVPVAMLQAYADRGVPIIQGYGLTEASPGVTMLRAEDSLRKMGSVGTPCMFTDVRVVDPGFGTPVDDQPGEILVQGPNVSPGYWHNPEATAEAFVDDGWLRTGDLALVDDEGHLRIVDRLKDMFISGGENVYPVEVESAIYTHPAVAECAVISVPDRTWGEVGRAVVTLRDGQSLTQEALLEHLQERLARYKVPRSVVFCDELPHNASGKLLKKAIRQVHGEPQEVTR